MFNFPERARIACIAAVGLTAIHLNPSQAAVVFSDTFNRPNDTLIGNAWTEVNALGSQNLTDADVSILDGALLLTNDSTTGTNYRGRSYVVQDASTFSGGYNTTFSSVGGVISWSFNTKLVYSINSSLVENDLTGFNYVGGGNYGIAFVLGAASKTNGGASKILTSGTSDNSGDGFGYAVVIGSSGTGTDDALRLVRFSDGLRGSALTNASITEIVKDTFDHTTDYISIRVTFDSTTGLWSLFEDSNTTAFVDPTSPLTQIGSSVGDTTYTTTPLPYMGALWNYANGSSTTNGGSRALFDNISISVTTPEVAVPEPTMGLVGLGSACTLGLRRRRS